MPITLKDIKTHREYYDIEDIVTMPTPKYRELLKREPYLFIESHGFVQHVISTEIIATNTEQSDVLIEQLQEFRKSMSKPLKWMSEK